MKEIIKASRPPNGERPAYIYNTTEHGWCQEIWTAHETSKIYADDAMKEKEIIKVFVDVQDGKTRCICVKTQRCRLKRYQPDVVERDKFRGWEETASRNRYGL